MNGINGWQSRTLASLFFALGDGLLVLTGFFLAGYFRFRLGFSGLWGMENWGMKAALLAAVIQTVFYYFDLYEPRGVREKFKMVVGLVQAMAVSFVLLAIITYSFPSLALGRGILAISLALIFPMAFLWRLFYARLIKGKIFKERILIVGSGEFAKKIFNELSENWRDNFEIVGFVDERGEIGKKI